MGRMAGLKVWNWDKPCAGVFGGIMRGATTFASKSQGCQWAGLVYFCSNFARNFSEICKGRQYKYDRNPLSLQCKDRQGRGSADIFALRYELIAEKVFSQHINGLNHLVLSRNTPNNFQVCVKGGQPGLYMLCLWIPMISTMKNQWRPTNLRRYGMIETLWWYDYNSPIFKAL